MKIKEVIVVEGHHDTNVLKQYFDCETIETNGLSLSLETIELIREAKEKYGVIIFTDPDHPGEKIRAKINEQIKGCKNAYIEKKKTKNSRQVGLEQGNRAAGGVEHASRADLEEALCHCFTYAETPSVTFTMEDLLQLGLQGRVDSSKRRAYLGKIYHLGKPNAKTLLKRLNLLQLSVSEVREQLEKGGFA